MEFEISKLKSLQYKLALSIAIIRNKPTSLSLDQYLKLLNTNFTRTHGKFSEEINQLKLKLLDAKKEIFYLKTRDILKEFDSNFDQNSLCSIIDREDKSKYSSDKENKFEQFNKQFYSNINFITDLIKLKTIEKEFIENKNVNQDTLLECLSQFLIQIKFFLFNYELKKDTSSEYNTQSSLIVTDTIENCTQPNVKDADSNSNSFSMTFPAESIIHGVEMFLNLYEIEWFYYMRNKILDQIVAFVDDIVRFIITFKPDQFTQFYFKKNEAKLLCCNQILFTLSTSDYLLNPIIYSIIKNLQTAIEYICDVKKYISLNSKIDDQSKLEKEREIENVSQNSVLLTECISSIVKLRLLDYYTPLSDLIKNYLNKILNTIFVNLTDTFPFIAIQLSKLIQLLLLNK